MWVYEKKLEYPVKIKNPNPALAKVIISQLGGPDGELGAATRYLQQRYSMPYAQVKGILTDVGTEELAHIEMISAILYQLTRNLSMCDIKKSGFDTYFVDHTTGVYPQAASGAAFSASTLQVTGDTLADLYEDLAAEQKARLSYDNILRLIDDPDVRDPIKFLREREIVHFQRFGDALRITQDHLNSKNFYAFNPSFDTQCNPKECRPIGAAPNCGCTPPIGERIDSYGCGTSAPIPSCDSSPAQPVPEPMPYCGCDVEQASEYAPVRGTGCRPPIMPAGCPTMQSNNRRQRTSCGGSCG